MADDLLLPADVARELQIERAFDREPTCEAANVGHYVDSRRKYVRCGIMREHFPVAGPDGLPLAAAAFCFGDYTSCPVWQAARDGTVDEIHANLDRRATERETRRQIVLGIRVDDRGVGAQRDDE